MTKHMTLYGIKIIRDDMEHVTSIETDSGHIIILPDNKFNINIEFDGEIVIAQITSI